MDAGNKGLERISHRRIARKIVAVAALLVGQTLAWPVAYEYLVADRCTAAGGSFDYDVSRCDFQAHHPGIVLWQRHGLSLAVACVLGVTGCALLLGRPK
jgi:hypothetical protein